jgi:hypothetical protein
MIVSSYMRGTCKRRASTQATYKGIVDLFSFIAAVVYHRCQDHERARFCILLVHDAARNDRNGMSSR